MFCKLPVTSPILPFVQLRYRCGFGSSDAFLCAWLRSATRVAGLADAGPRTVSSNGGRPWLREVNEVPGA